MLQSLLRGVPASQSPPVSSSLLQLDSHQCPNSGAPVTLMHVELHDRLSTHHSMWPWRNQRLKRSRNPTLGELTMLPIFRSFSPPCNALTSWQLIYTPYRSMANDRTLCDCVAGSTFECAATEKGDYCSCEFGMWISISATQKMFSQTAAETVYRQLTTRCFNNSEQQIDNLFSGKHFRIVVCLYSLINLIFGYIWNRLQYFARSRSRGG